MSVLHNIAAAMPPFTDNHVDRLRHTVAVFALDVTSDQWAIRATQNAVAGHDVTGLTWGDLRALLASIDQITTALDDVDAALDDDHVNRKIVLERLTGRIRDALGKEG